MKSLVFLFLLFITSHVFAQDLIVKNDGDSLNCLITRNENSYMYFNQIVNHRFKRDSLSLAHIKTFKVDYYSTKKSTETKPVSTPKPVTIQPYNTHKIQSTSNATYRPIYEKENNFFLSMGAGISNRTETLPSYLNQFQKDLYTDLYHGRVWGAEAGYFFNENFGFGFQFSQHLSSVYYENVVLEIDSANNIYEFGDYEVTVTINYFAPTFYARSISNNGKHILIGKASLGYTNYLRKEIFGGAFLATTNGDNLSITIGGSYHFMLDPHISLGASVDYNSAQINNANYKNRFNTIQPSFIIDINRYDLKILLAYWF